MICKPPLILQREQNVVQPIMQSEFFRYKFPSLVIYFYQSFCRTQPTSSIQQVKPEAGVTVVFHVLLASNFRMTEENFFIRAHGADLGDFQENCVDMIAAE